MCFSVVCVQCVAIQGGYRKNDSLKISITNAGA